MNEHLDSHPKLLLEHRKSMAQVAKEAVGAVAFGLGLFLGVAIALVIYFRVTFEAWEIAILALGGGGLGDSWGTTLGPTFAPAANFAAGSMTSGLPVFRPSDPAATVSTCRSMRS